MNQLESTSPGTKAQFFLGYLDRAAPLFATQDEVRAGRVRALRPADDRPVLRVLPRAGADPGRAARGPAGRTRLAGRAADDRETAEALSDEVMPVELFGTLPSMSGPFEAGERILLVDQRDRRYLLTLQTGETWHSHGGGLPHDLLIGSPEGTVVHSATGDGVPGVPAAAGRLRPEDAEGRPGRLPEGRRRDPGRGGRLPGRPGPGGRDRFGVAHARALPGHRARGPGGVVRPAARVPGRAARATSSRSSGRRPTGSSSATATSATSPGPARSFDRAILDLPEPWDGARAARDRAARRARSSAGTCRRRTRCSSSCSRLERNGYEHLETFEVLHRSWHVTARSVRPDHRMVAHTGFITRGAARLSIAARQAATD